MKSWSSILTFTTLALGVIPLVTSCKVTPQALPPDPRLLPQYSITLDQRLGQDLDRQVVQDLWAIEKIKWIKPGKDKVLVSQAGEESAQRWVQKVFPDEPSRSGVVAYLDKGITYLLPNRVRDRQVIKRPYSSYYGSNTEKSYRIASNMGITYWFEYLIAMGKDLDPTGVEMNGTIVPVEKSGIGFVFLDDIYAAKGKNRYPDIYRWSVLVHEARHSDCPSLSESDRKRLLNGELPLDRTCGHFHTICPKNHPYEGKPACDSEPWGAYAIELLFMNKILAECESCSKLDQQIALTNMADSYSRLLFPLAKMYSGEMGEP